MSIEREITQELKGIAVIFMVTHHLFRFPERIYEGNYISLTGNIYKNYNLEYLIGDFGKICISMFLFLSGLGFYLSKNVDFNSFKKRFVQFYKYYLYILTLVSLLGFFLIKGKLIKGKIMYSGGINELLLNILAIKTTYCGEWWFVGLYLQILLVSPLIFYILKKNIKISVGIHLFLYLFYFIGLFIKYTNFYFLKENIVYINFMRFNFYQIIYYLGIITAKLKLYEKIKIKINPYIGILSIFLIRNLTEKFKITVIFECSLVFLLIYFFLKILEKNKLSSMRKILEILGENCLNIWLIHSLYIYYFFQKLTYQPRYSFLILIWVIFLSFVTGKLLEKFYKKFIL
ncbi:MAG: acyltransferase family protein [Cetobacterium sp.]|uniref:acyltransferase family protein n=1 Tax=Cetobacterium sp. TaxID=2071632 RepID=UPI003AA1E892